MMMMMMMMRMGMRMGMRMRTRTRMRTRMVMVVEVGRVYASISTSHNDRISSQIKLLNTHECQA